MSKAWHHSPPLRLWGLNSKCLNIREHWCLQIIFWVSFAGSISTAINETVQRRETHAMNCPGNTLDGLSVSRKMKVTLLSLTSIRLVQILPDSIKQRQAVTRNSSSSQINIGTLRNNLVMEIEALKAIPSLSIPNPVQIPIMTESGRCPSKSTTSQHKNSYPCFYFLLLAALYLIIHSRKLCLLCIYFGSKVSLTKRFTGCLYLLTCQQSTLSSPLPLPKTE